MYLLSQKTLNTSILSQKLAPGVNFVKDFKGWLPQVLTYSVTYTVFKWMGGFLSEVRYRASVEHFFGAHFFETFFGTLFSGPSMFCCAVAAGRVL